MTDTDPSPGDRINHRGFDQYVTAADPPIVLPWSYWDGVVETELRVTTYPYGAGQPGVGVQLTLESRHLGQTIAIRLPEDTARRMALAVQGATAPGADADETRDELDARERHAAQECPDCTCCNRLQCDLKHCAGGTCPCTED